MTAKPSGSGQQLYYAGIAAVIIVILLALWLLFKPATESGTEISVLPPVITEPELVQPLPELIIEPTVGSDPLFAAETEVGAEVTPPEPVVAPQPLPKLEQSDPLLTAKLLEQNWQPGLAGLINTKQMVRNLVVTIDNLAQQQLVAKHPVVAPLDEPFKALIQQDGKTYQIDSAGYQRYQPYLQLLESVEPEQLVQLLQQYQPWFEQAFAELGYPEMSFKQRLAQAINQFLAIESPTVDTTLLRRSVAYTYADPTVEGRSALEKQIIRLGPANHQRLRAIALKYQAALQSTD